MIALFGRKRKQVDLDTAGTTASLLCAIHCALMPLVVTMLPLVGLGFLASEGVEWILLDLSAILGCASLCFGYRTHRRRGALAVLATGLALLAMGRLCEERGIDRQGLVLVVLGGLTVAASHIFNRRLCTACRTCNIEAQVDQLLHETGRAYRDGPPLERDGTSSQADKEKGTL